MWPGETLYIQPTSLVGFRGGSGPSAPVASYLRLPVYDCTLWVVNTDRLSHKQLELFNRLGIAGDYFPSVSVAATEEYLRWYLYRSHQLWRHQHTAGPGVGGRKTGLSAFQWSNRAHNPPLFFLCSQPPVPQWEQGVVMAVFPARHKSPSAGFRPEKRVEASSTLRPSKNKMTEKKNPLITQHEGNGQTPRPECGLLARSPRVVGTLGGHGSGQRQQCKPQQQANAVEHQTRHDDGCQPRPGQPGTAAR